MTKVFLIAGSLSGFLAVALGAFGAHALKERLSASELQTFHTGVNYQFYHAFALLIVGMLSVQFSDRSWSLSGFCFLIGTILFSGSLYTLVATGIRIFGAITPIGGVLFLLGWLTLAYQCFQVSNQISGHGQR